MNTTVAEFLATKAAEPPRLMPGNLIFAMDATASRGPTWDIAVHLQAKMFQEVAAIGALNIQLVYFRGAEGSNAECKASRWMPHPAELAAYMTGIKCLGGLTQIRRVLDHAITEAAQRKIAALVYVGDSFEELCPRLAAQKLRQLGVPVFVFQEGADPGAAESFREIAQITGGADETAREAGGLKEKRDRAAKPRGPEKTSFTRV